MPTQASSFILTSTMANIQGISLAFTYNIPAGSYDAPPHSAPPSKPGKIIVPSLLGGINCSPVLKFANFSVTKDSISGVNLLIISFVKACRANGGGFRGSGCVGQASSPSKSDLRTSLSSTGNNDSPVSRFKTYTCPDFVV